MKATPMTIFAVVDLVAIQVETWLTDPTGSHVNVHRILAVDIPAWDDDDGYRATHFVDGRGWRTADEFDDDCRAITIATVPTAQVFATLIANAHQTATVRLGRRRPVADTRTTRRPTGDHRPAPDRHASRTPARLDRHSGERTAHVRMRHTAPPNCPLTRARVAGRSPAGHHPSLFGLRRPVAARTRRPLCPSRLSRFGHDRPTDRHHMTTSAPKAPTELSTRSKALWRQV